MATFRPTDGVNEREPTLISDSALQDTDGAEYRVGEVGLYVARGRDLYGAISGFTGKGLYEAGFDSSAGYIVAHEGNSLHAAIVGSTTLSFSLIDNLPSGTSAVVGSHYANRHYIATNVGNRRLESTGSGVTSFPIGMSESTLAVTTAVSGSAGDMSATTGLIYWVTEYDSSRGIESLAGSTTDTGSFTSKADVTVTVTGTSSNTRADQLRWYRSTDGGGFPDGGLIQTTAIGTTQITDTSTATVSLSVPLYGIVSIGGLDTERDAEPPAFSIIFGPFQDSLMGVDPDEPRTLRFTPAGYPDSWPAPYAIPLETHRRDEIVTGVLLPHRIGVLCNDSVHTIYRLPRDSDSIFAAGEMQEQITDQRGCVSRRGATAFTPPGSPALAAWVARDGIWVSDLTSSPSPVTDLTDWEGRVDVANLPLCRLVDDPRNRRLVFIYRKESDTTHNTGVWYLDYQEFTTRGIRIAFADHGPLSDAQTIAGADGKRTLVSIDSRSANGQIYQEATQDVDDSQLRDSSGSVRFRMLVKEFLPAGARGSVHLGKATWMHDAGPSSITHKFYFDRRDSNPEEKELPDPDTRNGSHVELARNVNSVSLELSSTGTKSYGVHWVDIEGFDPEPLGPRKGA